MAVTIKSLAQAALATTALTDVYTVAAATTAVVSSIVITNQTSAGVTFRVSHALAGAADAVKQYLYYDLTLPANDTFIATVGITMAATDVLRFKAGTANALSIQVYGQENT